MNCSSPGGMVLSIRGARAVLPQDVYLTTKAHSHRLARRHDKQHGPQPAGCWCLAGAGGGVFPALP